MCSGYYRYDEGYTPGVRRARAFAGQVVHPQHWPEDLDYAGKQVVVIGSGATAVTLVPALAETRGARDDAPALADLHRLAARARIRVAELRCAASCRRRPRYSIVRWKNVALLTIASFQLSRRLPGAREGVMRRGVTERSSPTAFDVDAHFKPRYNPWDQRLCVVPDGDLFRALRDGQRVDRHRQIETFTETGIRLDVGRRARGRHHRHGDRAEPPRARRRWQLRSTARRSTLPDTLAYKGMMLGGVPNLAFASATRTRRGR